MITVNLQLLGGRGASMGGSNSISAPAPLPMPELIGTERQVEWATDLRDTQKERLERTLKLLEKQARDPDYNAMNEADLLDRRAWIALRFNLPGYMDRERALTKELRAQDKYKGPEGRERMKRERSRMMYEWSKNKAVEIMSNADAKYWIDKR